MRVIPFTYLKEKTRWVAPSEDTWMSERFQAILQIKDYP